MGYDVTLYPCGFNTPLDKETFQERYRKCLEDLDMNDGGVEEDDFYFDFTPSKFSHVEVNGNCRGRENKDNFLAKFISRVIAIGSYAMLELKGEDDYMWGHLIFHTTVFEASVGKYNIYPIDYEIVKTVGGQLVDTVIQRRSIPGV